jgi:hypothetical protein
MRSDSVHSKDVHSVYLELLWMISDELRNAEDQMSWATKMIAVYNLAASGRRKFMILNIH